MQSSPPFARTRHAVTRVVTSPRHGPVTALGALVLVAVVATTSATFARPAPESFADLVEQVAPAVVTVTTVQETSARASLPEEQHPPLLPDSPYRDFFERFFGRNDPRDNASPPPTSRVTGVGSGFILDPDGTIVTNNHVVAGAAKIMVTLKDNRTFEAALMGRDEKTDLAVLKIAPKDALPSVAFGDSDRVRVGDWVMAVGNPFGLGGTVTAGIVSARGRDLAGGTLIDFLQIDAAINRGNSGGPAFNGKGEVIGINTAIFSPNGGNVGIGFAIPSNLAEQVISQLREHGTVERGWLGVRIQPVSPEIAEAVGLDQPRGALIASVEEDSPAASAGLEAGDVVLGWDGREVANFKDLPRYVAATPAETSVEVKLWRGTKARSLRVTTGRMAGDQRLAARGERPDNGTSIEQVAGTGLVVGDLTPALRARFGIDDTVTGVVVLDVDANGTAAVQGLRAGDVIASIGLEPVSSADQAAHKVALLRDAGRTVVMVGVTRRGTASFLALRLADA